MQSSQTRPETKPICLAIKQERLERLLQQGDLHAADFNCLDSQSKLTVWRMLLATTANRVKQL